MTDHPVIAIENLSQTVKNEVLFTDVSFEINKHEFVSLKGPSGCGKTTFLRILAGLVEPSGGKIMLHGRIANNPGLIIPPHERKMNLLFQELALWPHMKGLEQLKFVWESTKKGVFEEQVEIVCNEIGLPAKLLSKYPSELSRGEQQRLAIARTLISRPEILLLDEPLTALDQQLREQFILFLQQLKKKRVMTVLVVSHDLMTNVVRYDKELIYDNNTFNNTFREVK